MSYRLPSCCTFIIALAFAFVNDVGCSFGESGTGAVTARGIGRTIRLFVHKKLGRHTTDTGLRRAELSDGATSLIRQ